MVDLHDLERATDERLAELEGRVSAPAPVASAAQPPPAPGVPPWPAPRRRLGALAPWLAVLVLLGVLVVAYMRGTRGGTR